MLTRASSFFCCARGAGPYGFATLVPFDDDHSRTPIKAWDLTEDAMPKLDAAQILCHQDQMLLDLRNQAPGEDPHEGRDHPGHHSHEEYKNH